jgi:hypothetical protein
MLLAPQEFSCEEKREHKGKRPTRRRESLPNI